MAIEREGGREGGREEGREREGEREGERETGDAYSRLHTSVSSIHSSCLLCHMIPGASERFREGFSVNGAHHSVTSGIIHKV